jgi:xanthine dehydrogenase accessory factor
MVEQQHGPLIVMETIITKVKGSAPTQAGDSMLLLSNGQWRGTVGGGNLEWKLMQTAQLTQFRIKQLGKLPGAKTMQLDHGLGCATDQCCGGRVQAYLVPIPPQLASLMNDSSSRLYHYSNDGYLQLVGGFNRHQQWQGLAGDDGNHQALLRNYLSQPDCDPPPNDYFVVRASFKPKLWIFGAGHIARVLAPMADSLNYDVSIFDGREHWANPQAFPCNVTVHVQALPNPDQRPDPNTTVLVMSHSHKLDYQLLQLMHDWPLDYLGVIGSKTKSLRFRQRMDNEGLDDSQVHMPIGIADMGKEPMEVAISVMAELLQRRNKSRLKAEPQRELGNIQSQDYLSVSKERLHQSIA